MTNVRFPNLSTPLLLGCQLLCATPGAVAAGLDYEARIVTLPLGTEPPGLDPSRLKDTVSWTIAGHVFEGLTRHDPEGRVVPGVAERWEIDADGATFWLREDARWSDGRPITARDFVFAWRRLVDPETAASSAYRAKGIENAQAIIEGKADPDTLGVRAASDRVLEVSFEHPLPLFEHEVAFPRFGPLREDVVRAHGEAFAADADRMLYNGPFVITEWVHDQRLRLRRNPAYWNADAIWLEGVHFDYVTSDPRALANLFRDGQIAFTPLDASTLPDAVERGERIQRFLPGAVAMITFNLREERPTHDLHLRRALALATDPREIVTRVARSPGTRPARSLFPSTMRVDGEPLHALIGAQAHRVDFDAARAELALARKALGVERLPPLVLLSMNEPTVMRVDEHLQSRWSEVLGLDVRVVRQNFKQALAQASEGRFDARLIGWNGNLWDPVSYAEPFTAGAGFNGGAYESETYDACVERARRSTERAERIDAYRCIHERWTEDRAGLTVSEIARNYLVHPRLAGFVRSPYLHDPDLTHARILPPAEEE